MSDDEKPGGPDLSKGVPAGDIAEGKMLAGHVGDEAVLIARVDDTLRAIGATCTHWGGPLAEGLIVGATVRCPWHHARFCLKTGEAIGAPAFDPVAVWSVEERNGKVFVKPGQSASKPEPAGDKKKRVVIVGGGAAGFAAAEMLRRKGFAGPVTILSADIELPYDRPNCSKDYLAGKLPREQTTLRDRDFYKDADIDLRLGVQAEGLDVAARTVSIKDGEPVAYDVLILATGAEPQRPPIPGLDGPNVHMLRTLTDADALIDAAKTAKRAVVIGSSFIGLEVAASLRQRGLAVTVAAPENTPFEKVLGQEVGAWVKSLHEKQGLVFRLGTKVTGYADGKVTIEDGEPIPADLVVVGAGVKPRVELAEKAGLKVDNGVVVDDHLKTSADGVYAAGDIARYPDPISGRMIRVEHWVHAERQGQYLARLILGEDAAFAEAPFFWTNQYDGTVSYSGHAEKFDPLEVDGSVADEDATILYNEDGKLTAVATINRDVELLQAEMDFEA